MMPPEPAPTRSTRYHAFDSLRAALMLLGVAVHGALSYTHSPPGRLWAFKDAQASVACDLIVLGSGLFRMPAFFVLSGFFAARSHRKYGPGALMRDRIRRIAVPMAVTWVIAFPLTRAAFAWVRTPAEVGPLSSAGLALRQGTLLEAPGPLHLWFLQYLILYYAAMVGLIGMLRAIAPSGGLAGRVDSAFRALVRSAWCPLGLALCTLPSLWASPAGLYDTPATFRPPASSLSGYFAFFAFGWLLARQTDLLPELARTPILRLGLAVLVVPLSATATVLRRAGLAPELVDRLAGPIHLASALAASLAGWLLVLGLMGLMLRYLDRPLRGIRPLADASYWIYLAHLPILAWLAPHLADVALPGLAKLAIVLTSTLALLMLAYQLRPRSIRPGPAASVRRPAPAAAESPA